MRPITFAAETNRGDVVTLEGYPTTARGLVVITRNGGTCGDKTCWQIVHARSGIVLAHCWDSPEGALAGADALAAFADWQQTWEDTKAAVRGNGPQMNAAVDRVGARPCGRKATRTLRKLAKPHVDNGVIA